jgi:hypothetical protein
MELKELLLDVLLVLPQDASCLIHECAKLLEHFRGKLFLDFLAEIEVPLKFLGSGFAVELHCRF